MILSVAVSPGFKIVPLGIPLALKPGPDTLILPIVTAELVEFVKLIVAVLVSPDRHASKAGRRVFSARSFATSRSVPSASLWIGQPALRAHDGTQKK